MAETFPTDSLISKFKEEVGEKDLVPWDCAEGSFEEFELDCNSSNGWDVNDMFKQNEQTYGVISNFDDELSGYTVPLKNENNIDYNEIVAKASKIASEIESNKQRMSQLEIDGDDGEEEKFASVVRSPPDTIPEARKKCHESFEKGKINKNGINSVYHFVDNNKNNIRNPSKKKDMPAGQMAEYRFKSEKEKAKRIIKYQNNSEINVNSPGSSTANAESQIQNDTGRLTTEGNVQSVYDLFRKKGSITKHFSFDGGDFKYLNSTLNPNAKPFIPRSEIKSSSSQTTPVSKSLPCVNSSTFNAQKQSCIAAELKVSIPDNDKSTFEKSPIGNIPLLGQVKSQSPPGIYTTTWNAPVQSQSFLQQPRPHSTPLYPLPGTHEMAQVPLGLKINARRLNVCTCYPVCCVQSLHPPHTLHS